jgi:hypothetical protein
VLQSARACTQVRQVALASRLLLRLRVPDERDDPLKSGGTLDLVIFLLWATVLVFALSQL